MYNVDVFVNVLALKIQVSDNAHDALMAFPEFITECRGDTYVKVKKCRLLYGIPKIIDEFSLHIFFTRFFCFRSSVRRPSPCSLFVDHPFTVLFQAYNLSVLQILPIMQRRLRRFDSLFQLQGMKEIIPQLGRNYYRTNQQSSSWLCVYVCLCVSV